MGPYVSTLSSDGMQIALLSPQTLQSYGQELGNKHQFKEWKYQMIQTEDSLCGQRIWRRRCSQGLKVLQVSKSVGNGAREIVVG